MAVEELARREIEADGIGASQLWSASFGPDRRGGRKTAFEMKWQLLEQQPLK